MDLYRNCQDPVRCVGPWIISKPHTIWNHTTAVFRSETSQPFELWRVSGKDCSPFVSTSTADDILSPTLPSMCKNSAGPTCWDAHRKIEESPAILSDVVFSTTC